MAESRENDWQADLPSAYHVADRWDSFDALAPAVNARFAEWRGDAGD